MGLETRNTKTQNMKTWEEKPSNLAIKTEEENCELR